MIKSSSSSTNPCGTDTTSNCVTWEGDDISCLGIEKGQTLSVSVKAIADEVCSLMDTLDLSDIDLKCIFDLCVSCPEPVKTLKTVLELLINKVCDINDAVNAITTATGAGTDPILTLASCFQYTDVDGDLVIELPESQYVKVIANKICTVLLDLSSLQDTVDDLSNSVNDLQAQVNALSTDIPDVTSDCLYSGSKSIDDAWDLLDQAFCQLRTAVGLPTDINIAIGRQCTGLSTELAGSDGWQTSPSNLAQSVNNLWIAFCDLRGRVVTIEDTCCAVSCKDVLIGFTVTLSDDRTTATVRFTAGAGTDIPSGFSDEGSTMTVTDQSGNTMDFSVTVANNGEETLTLTGLNVDDDYDFSLNAIVGNGSLTCEKCVSRKVTFASTCSYCEICVTGSSGTVTIVYSDSTQFVSTPFEPSTTTTTTTTAPA